MGGLYLRLFTYSLIWTTVNLSVNRLRTHPKAWTPTGMTSISSRRLRKELTEIQTEGCPTGTFSHLLYVQLTDSPSITGITLLSADNFETWYFSIEILGESLYQV